ncbi:MAG: TrmH family RNA methyltransferase [Coriobacteriales bacterium]|jgi:tRNA G18 (ribose-2'-O)-methylase SpoU
MSFVPVQTCTEDGLEVYSGMTDTQLRKSPDAAHGLFIAESVKVAERALDAGVKPYSAFVEDRWFDQSRQLVDRIETANPEAPVFRLDHDQMHAVTGYEVTRGPLVAFMRPEPLSLDALLDGATRIAIVEDVTNYANIGAIFRSAAALGMDGIIATPGCHDPLYRRAARVSMGTVFQVPWLHLDGPNDWAPAGIELLHERGFTVAALALADDAVALNDPLLSSMERLALVLGTEGTGLRPSTLEAADCKVIIPMQHGVDSLNVAAASAVAFWELCTKR